MRAVLWLLLIVVFLAVLAVVGIPVWLVQPFAPQTPDGLDWSWTLRRLAPTATAIGLGLSLLLAAALWRGLAPCPLPRPRLRRWARRVASRQTALVLLVLPVAFAAWFARQNHFEWLFRPFPDAQFVDAGAVKDLESREPVIGVTGARDALAFPITRIGYHHLINTTLGDLPIVATY